MPCSGSNSQRQSFIIKVRQRISSLALFISPSHTALFHEVSMVLIIGTVYGCTLAPGLTWANGGTDGGDLITAAATHGVAHPSGYPLYLLLAELFQWIPAGNLAFRTNLLSAVCAITASVFLYRVTCLILDGKPYNRLASWGSALLFGFSHLVWSQAVITEVYALQTLLTALMFYLAFFNRQWRYQDIVCGLVGGLALGNHLTSLFLIPLLFWKTEEFVPGTKRRTFLRAIGILIGTLIYLILPLRAIQNPPVSWNNPTTLSSLFQLITGQIYQGYFTLLYLPDRLRGLAGLFIDQFNAIGMAVGFFSLLGGRISLRKNIPLFWVFLSSCCFALVYGTFDSYVYVIPAVMVFSIWIAGGIQEIVDILSSNRKLSQPAIYLALLLAIAYQIFSTIPTVDASKDARAETFGIAVMQSVPENSLVFTGDDESTFALWYFHFALNQRPDITVISTGLLQFPWYQRTLEYTYPDLIVPDSGSFTVESIRRNNSTRPYYVIDNYRNYLNILSKINSKNQ